MTSPPDFLNSLPGPVAIVGVGLLGGSVAATLKRIAPGVRCVGYARSAVSARRLKDYPWLDDVHTDPESLIESACVVVIATPVGDIAQWVERVHSINPRAVITDVGSTKATIVDHVGDVPRFVPAHPIAGSEQSGPGAATDDLFDDKITLLTPTDATAAESLSTVDQFWQSLGCRTRIVTPDQHDAMMAVVSHAPHILSTLIAATTDPDHRDVVGSGWRDMTRVAAGDVEMWTQIVGENSLAIDQQLRRIRDELDRWIEQLNDTDAVRQKFETARQRKLQIDAPEIQP